MFLKGVTMFSSLLLTLSEQQAASKREAPPLLDYRAMESLSL
jgi:hypothetical protein